MKGMRFITILSILLISLAMVGSMSVWVYSLQYDADCDEFGKHRIVYTSDDTYHAEDYKEAHKIDEKTTTKNGIHIQDGTVYILRGGTYYLNGSFENIIVESADNRPVAIELDNVYIESKKRPPLYVSKASKLILSTAEGTESFVIDERIHQTNNDERSAIYSVTDITINGAGTLHVEGNYSDGITSAGVVKLMSGTLDVTADDDGITGKVQALKGGKLIVTSNGDAIRAVDDPKNNIILVDQCNIIVNSQSDGLYSEGDIYLKSGICNVQTGGNIHGSGTQNMPTTELQPSAKAFKADGEIHFLNGNGQYTANSFDDAVHAGGNIEINGGRLELASGDDAVHTDTNLYVSNGIINVSTCYEGLESKYMEIKGGNIHIYADDDGINVAGEGTSPLGGMPLGGGNFGGMPPRIEDDGTAKMDFVMNGGTVWLQAGGDGIDINGSCEINGGEIESYNIKEGPENAFDFDGICRFNGGTFLGTGNPNMAVPPSDKSASPALVVYPPKAYRGNNMVRIQDEKDTIIEKEIEGAFGWIGLYGDKLIKNKTYSVFVNDEKITDAKIDQTVVEVYCESEDGQGLPGISQPPDAGGMNGQPPPPLGAGGMNGQPPPPPDAGGMNGQLPPPPDAGGRNGQPPPPPPPDGRAPAEVDMTERTTSDRGNANTGIELLLSGCCCLFILFCTLAVSKIKRIN